MRAWKLSEAGASSSLVDSDDEDVDGSGNDSDSNGEDVIMAHEDSVPADTSFTLPLPLSTPAYNQDPVDSPIAGPSRTRVRMPILSFADNEASPSQTSADSPDGHSASRFAPIRPKVQLGTKPNGNSATNSRYQSRAYPSPTSSPSGSQPSSPSSHPLYAPLDFPHDDSDSNYTSTAHFSHSTFYSNSTSRPKSVSKPKRQRQSRKVRLAEKTEALYALDPHPLSTILGDTYSLGVIALCIDLDELVDVEPGVQMCEEWDWKELTAAKGGLKIFAGEPAKPGVVERYLQSVKTREKCKVSDAVDVESMRQAELEEDINTRARANAAAQASSAASALGEVMEVDSISIRPDTG